MSAAGAPIGEAEWARLRQESVASIEDVALRARKRLPDVLLAYQRRTVRLLESVSTRVLFVEKSRRIGLTWGLAAYAVLRASRSKAARGMDAMYISYSQEMTREFVDACAMWARAFAVAAGEVGEFLFEDAAPDDPGQTRQIKAFRIRFASGFEIIALSSAPRSLRGKQGLVIIDEAAFVESLAELLKAALAFLMWGGQVVVCSTHNGIDNPFAETIDEIRSGRKAYAHMKITLDDALADGLYRRICLVTRQPWSPEAEAKWRADLVADYGDAADEELFCIPSQSAGCWIDPELIAAATHPDAGDPNGYRGGMVTVGNDIARRKDQWVAAALERVGDVLWAREERILQNQPFAVQDDVLDELVGTAKRPGRYRVARVAMDQTGMGEKPVEDAKTRYGEYRVEGVLMAGDRPLNVATSARRAFEERLIRIPDDPALRAELRMIKKVIGPTGAPRLLTGRDKASHADRAWALFLAIAAADGLVGQDFAETLGQARPSTAALDGFELDAGGAGLSDFMRM